MVLPHLASRSWSLPSFFDLGESISRDDSDEMGTNGPDGSESCTSYSTESSHEFVVDENYMIIAHADSFDEEMSDIVDSCASSNQGSAGSTCVKGQPPRRTRCSNGSQRTLQNHLAAIAEEEEADPCEAYLRAKMTSLWTRIQEIAHQEDLSATPSTDQDAELLNSYAKKNDSLVVLRRMPKLNEDHSIGSDPITPI